MPIKDEIELLTPADAGQGAAARAVAMQLAAEEEMDLDQVADLRLVVGEACEVLVGLAVPDSTLRCTFHAAPGRLEMTMEVRTAADRRDTDCLRHSVQWQAMGTLADHLRLSFGQDIGYGEHVLTVELASARHGRPAG